MLKDQMKKSQFWLYAHPSIHLKFINWSKVGYQKKQKKRFVQLLQETWTLGTRLQEESNKLTIERTSQRNIFYYKASIFGHNKCFVEQNMVHWLKNIDLRRTLT